MPSRQIALVRHTFDRVAMASGVAALVFYRNLFTLAPSLLPLFGTDILSQAGKLMETVRLIVDGLDEPQSLIPMLEQLGALYSSHGVSDAQYETAGRAWILMLSQTLGDELSDEAMGAWESTWKWTAGIMLNGARAAAGNTGSPIPQTGSGAGR